MLDPKTIRNVAVIAHDGAGKTALTEALLRHDAPARASKDGSTSHLDVDPEEAKRNFTVTTHITFAEHDGTLLNLLFGGGLELAASGILGSILGALIALWVWRRMRSSAAAT